MYIGIDLGTTSSEAAFIDEKGNIQIIPAAEGSFGGKNFPSVVGFNKDQIIVGLTAKRMPIEKFIEFKRDMGTGKKYYSKTLDRYFTPQELSALVLKKIKQDAEQYLNKEVTGAVITVPAYFNDNQRQATKDAARIAGIECKRIINEPTAAAIAYGFKGDEDIKVAVLDMGGGTFDVSILEIADGVFQVISTSGDTRLGGSDIDELILAYIRDSIDAECSEEEWQIIREAVERGKMELSTTSATAIYVPRLVNVTLSRAELEKIIVPVTSRLIRPVQQALDDANLSPKDIDRVLLVGGSIKVPAIRQLFENIFGKTKIAGGVDPLRAVASGAAVQAAILEGRFKSEALLVDVTPLSLGVEIKDGLISRIIERNTPIPVRKSKLFTTVYDNQPAVRVKVYQGEREFAKDNIYLGELVLNVLPAPAGIPRIEVAFEIDENGILVVTVKDTGTGKEEKVRIEAPHRLSEEEVKQMLLDAEKHVEEDRRKRELVELKDRARIVIEQISSVVDSTAVDNESRRELLQAHDNLKNSLSKTDPSVISVHLKHAEELLRRIAEEVYSKK